MIPELLRANGIPQAQQQPAQLPASCGNSKRARGPTESGLPGDNEISILELLYQNTPHHSASD